MNDIIHLDLSNLRESSMGDEEFIQDMIVLFIERGAEKLALLKDELSDGINPVWVSHSHAFKGLAANIGAPYLREICANSQSMETASQTERAEILKQIEHEYRIVVSELNKEIKP